jgi:Flp pilus assembly protein TadG
VRNERGAERGQGLVEFAMLVPILVLITMGAIDFGRIFFVYTTLADAANQGAVCASVGTSLCPAGAAAAANTEVSGTLPGGVTTAVTGGGSPGSSVTVTVTYNFQATTTAILGATTFPVKASATRVVQ